MLHFIIGKGGGGIDIGIGDVTLVRMFKSLIWMTHYFSSKLNVLGISKYISLLLDILATIQFLFHHFCLSIKRARIFLIILIFWLWKTLFDSDHCDISHK